MGDAVWFTAIHTLCFLSAMPLHQKETRKVKGMPFMNIWNKEYQSYQPFDMVGLFVYISSPSKAKHITKNTFFHFCTKLNLGVISIGSFKN